MDRRQLLRVPKVTWRDVGKAYNFVCAFRIFLALVTLHFKC